MLVCIFVLVAPVSFLSHPCVIYVLFFVCVCRGSPGNPMCRDVEAFSLTTCELMCAGTWISDCAYGFAPPPSVCDIECILVYSFIIEFIVLKMYCIVCSNGLSFKQIYYCHYLCTEPWCTEKLTCAILLFCPCSHEWCEMEGYCNHETLKFSLNSLHSSSNTSSFAFWAGYRSSRSNHKIISEKYRLFLPNS